MLLCEWINVYRRGSLFTGGFVKEGLCDSAFASAYTALECACVCLFNDRRFQ